MKPLTTSKARTIEEDSTNKKQKNIFHRIMDGMSGVGFPLPECPLPTKIEFHETKS